MRKIIITGVSRGIGKAFLDLCLKMDESVLGIGRSPAVSDKKYDFSRADLSDTRQTMVLLEQLSLEGIKEIVLVNNAGTLGQVSYLESDNFENIEKVFALNSLTPFYFMNHFIKKCNELKIRLTIINISSGAASYAVDGWANYCASKAALDMFSEVLAVELREKKSPHRIFCVSPGVVKTQMQQEIREVDPEQFSSREKFIEYFENDELSDPNETARKIWHLYTHQNEFSDVKVNFRLLHLDPASQEQLDEGVE